MKCNCFITCSLVKIPVYNLSILIMTNQYKHVYFNYHGYEIARIHSRSRQ